MKNKKFIAIVQQATVINDDKRAELISVSEWLSDDERTQLVKSFTSAELDIKDIEQGNGKRLKRLNKALGEFRKQEVPKLIKELEKSDKNSEGKENPEELLKEWENNEEKK